MTVRALAKALARGRRMGSDKSRDSLARKLRATSARYRYRIGVWTAMSDVAIGHCKKRERAAIREAVEPVIAVLEMGYSGHVSESTVWRALQMLRKLGG